MTSVEALSARATATGEVIVPRLRVADTHWTRLRGLLGTASLDASEGLWIRPCRQVHMFGMRYPVDLAFLDDGHRVVRTVEALQPGRISPRVAGAQSVLELPAGAVARTGLRPGEHLSIDGANVGGSRTRSDVGAIVCNLLLAALYLRFAWVHVGFASRTGQWATALPVVAQEAMLVFLFLTRRRSLATSSRPVDWAVGIVGTFLPLLMRATDSAGPLAWLGSTLQILGLLLGVVGLASLGRSVGIVAADRGIKTGGLYRHVRHPMYASYVVSYCGFAAAYPSAWNALIVVTSILALNARAIAEERFLARDPVYKDYLRRMRWRFVPQLY